MQWPMILGHEGAGIVESVGSGVTEVKPGTFFHFNGFCKHESNMIIIIEKKVKNNK